jgi:hypothetical protein
VAPGRAPKVVLRRHLAVTTDAGDDMTTIPPTPAPGAGATHAAPWLIDVAAGLALLRHPDA